MAAIATFTQQLVEGNIDGVRNSLMPEFVDMIIDERNGYRPIHVACRHGYVDIAMLLIDNRCNMEHASNGELKPIHLGCKEGHLEIVKLLIKHQCNVESETEEEYRPIHLACQYGHFGIARLLIEYGCCIESETYEVSHYLSFIKPFCLSQKHRPIHLTCINGHLDIARLLMEYHCNIESESFNKHRPIHLACINGHLEVVRQLVHFQCNIESTASIMKYRSIHLACVNGHLKISKFLIDSQCNIESESFNKYRPIHLACEIGHYDMVKILINNQCNVDCETINKYRPIHLASMKGHIDIVKLLVESKCEIQCQTQNGCLPGDLAEKAGFMAVVEFLNAIENVKKIFNCIKTNDDSRFVKLSSYLGIDPRDESMDFSVLESVVQRNADGIMRFLLERNVDDEEIFELANVTDGIHNSNTVDRLWLECLFYRCIRDHHQAGFQMLCTASIINGHREIVRSSFLELAAEHGSHTFINDILRKCIYDNEAWERAKNQALKKGYQQIFDTILNRETLLKSRKEAHLSILHTAICDNDADMVRYILENNLVDPNSNNPIVGTSLAFAYMLCHQQCATVLQQFHVDPNTENQFLQTPLHEAIASGINEHCAYLINEACDIDKTGFMGFTALQRAVMRGSDQVCQQLVNRGADCSLYIQLPQEFILDKTDIKRLNTEISLSRNENALTLCLKFHGTLFPCFLNILDMDKSNSCDGAGNSLLHLAVGNLQPTVCQSLITSHAVVDKVNELGNTCLLELLCNSTDETCHEKIIDIANILINSGADINRTTIDGVTCLQLASKFHNERLMVVLVSQCPNLTRITELDLQLALTDHWFNYATSLLERIPTELVAATMTSELFHLILPHANSQLLHALYNRATNDVKQSVIEDIIYQTSLIADDDLFESLLNADIGSPKCFDNGETLLTNLMIDNKIKYCLNIFQSKNNINFVNLKNKKQQIPLQIAIEIGSMDMVDHLIFESDQLDNEDETGNTALTLLFDKLSADNDANMELKLLSSIKSIIARGGNIYKTTSRQQQAIDACAHVSLRSDIELFHRSERDKLEKSSLERVMGVENVIIEKVIEVEKICNVCIERVVNCVIECGHTFCMDCGNGFVQCPFCKFEPTNPKRIFFN